ncbi:16S rRNA (guanine(966)-N(2))-methyltransferase RsmD [Acetobacterium bakii]|uniref:Methyltransferase n=1 Tax=Acetobacterium bakii TaxID=52689 RepID=A0A0L6TYL4_9FIRM|nr:16S rRNA (guanine(966)-N(2))-methyltransferase RsmD [Acetobacterium bakii]KNZ41187.1 methyltransferase [Acetobacterium bakii]
MRVIAGEKRGKILVGISGDKIRPTTDKIKGAIFSSIQADLRNAKVFVDLFGGSGAMGIEALSRGVEMAYFFDSSRESIEIIKKNVALTGYESRVKIIQTTAIKGIEMFHQNKAVCDIIFMDPPYIQGDSFGELLEMISEKEILSENGKVVIESEKSVIMPLEKNNLVCYKTKKYGNSKISYFCREKNEFKNSSLSGEF